MKKRKKKTKQTCLAINSCCLLVTLKVLTFQFGPCITLYVFLYLYDKLGPGARMVCLDNGVYHDKKVRNSCSFNVMLE